LAEREPDSNANESSDNTVISPILAIYVTTIIEHLAEYLLTTVAMAAENEDTEFVRVREVFTALIDDTHVADAFSKMELKERLEKRLVASGFRLKRSATPISFAPQTKVLDTPKRFDFGNFEFEEDDDDDDTNNMNHSDRGAKNSAASMFGGRTNTGSTYRPTSVLSSTPSSLTVNSQHGSIGSKKAFKLFNKNGKRHSVDFHSFEPRSTTVYDPEAPGLNFEELIRSGSTMKMSLTPNRLRTIEIEDQNARQAESGDEWARKLPAIRPESPRPRPREADKKVTQNSLPNNNGSRRPPTMPRSSSFSLLDLPIPSATPQKSTTPEPAQKPAISTMFDLPLDFLASPTTALTPPSPKRLPSDRNKPQPVPLGQAIKYPTEPLLPKPSNISQIDLSKSHRTPTGTNIVVQSSEQVDKQDKSRVNGKESNVAVSDNAESQAKRLPAKPPTTETKETIQSARQEIVRSILQDSKSAVKTTDNKVNPPSENAMIKQIQEQIDVSEKDAPIRPPRQKPITAKQSTPTRHELTPSQEGRARATSNPVTKQSTSLSRATGQLMATNTKVAAPEMARTRLETISSSGRSQESLVSEAPETPAKAPVSLTNIPPSKFEAAKAAKQRAANPQPKSELPKSVSENNIVRASEPEFTAEPEEMESPKPAKAAIKPKAEPKAVPRPSEATERAERKMMSRPGTPDRPASIVISPERPSSIVAKRRSMSGTLPLTEQQKIAGSVEKSVKVWDDYLKHNAKHTIIRRRSQIRSEPPSEGDNDTKPDSYEDLPAKELTREPTREYSHPKVPVIPQGVLEKVRKFERQRSDLTLLDSSEAVKQARERIAASRKAVRMSLYRTVAVDASTQTDFAPVDQGVQTGETELNGSEIAESEVSERGVIDGDEEWFLDEWDEDDAEDESAVAEWLLGC